MSTTNDRVLLGIALMIGFSLIAPIMDAFAKAASAYVPVGETVAFRFGVQTLLLLPLVLRLADLRWPSMREWGLHLLRAAMILFATAAFFTALGVMPMADSIAIFFVEPFILTLLGGLFLGETIGWRRIIACAVGFGGALLIIRPSFSDFGLVAFLPLLTALLFAFYMVLTRKMAPHNHPVALQFWTAVAACIWIFPALVVFDGTGFAPLDPVMPPAPSWVLLLGVGIAATVSHLFITYALRFAPAGVIAPLQYAEIISAVAIGYLVFNDIPDVQAMIGIAIIVGSGLYVFIRERALTRHKLPQPPA